MTVGVRSHPPGRPALPRLWGDRPGPPALARPVRRRVERLTVAAIVSVMCLSVLLLMFTGSVVYAAVAPAAAVVAYLIWTQPVRRTLIPVIFAQFFLFIPPYASGALWSSVLEPAFRVAFGLLNKLTGIRLLSFTGTEAAFLALFALLAIRELRGHRTDAEGRVTGATVLFAFVGLQFACVVLLEIWGIATGGDPVTSIFQVRVFMSIPLQILVFSYALRSSRDFKRLAIVATVATALKIGVGLYFINKDAWAQGIESPYMTSHGDTVLFVSLFILWLAQWAHQPTGRRLLVMLLVNGALLLAIVVNNRRLAWVSLVASLMVFYFSVTGPLRRRANLTLLALSPFIAIYFAIATKVDTGIFSPGAKIVGISKIADPSTQWRILENRNLVWNLNQHRFIGAGFGKEWVEVEKLPDVSDSFAEYRLTAHNSVLWLLQVSGILGFIFMWMPLVVGVFLAARSYRCAHDAYQRTCAVTVIAVVLCYANQAWGDIGLLDPPATMLLSLSLALAAKLAIETGAWPRQARLLSR